MAIKLVIADDDRLITESMRIILDMDADFDVVGVAENGKNALEMCQAQAVDVALLDIRMPVMDGVEATRLITQNTSTRVLILTTFDEDEYIKKAFEYGAGGYLLKNNPPEQIKNAIKAVAGGSTVVQAAVMEKISHPEKDDSEKLKGLTEREAEVVLAIAEGLTNKEIAAKLFISEGTVKNNITAILSKLNLNHRTQIAIYYLSHD